ncbi:MAG: MerR family transcriptional regulator [Microbacterium sp.]
MDWSIQEVARIAGTTSRTLRHYESEGLLPATRVGSNGYRRYDEAALVRLQRILLLRELGLGLARIREVLDRETDEGRALSAHLGLLRQERERVARQIAAVEETLRARTEGEEIMLETMFDGFDHTQHREEVESRWGADAYASGDRWWRGLTEDERRVWQGRSAALARDWASAASAGVDPSSAEAQELARRHVEWLTSVPGTPAAGGRDVRGYVIGLGEMYVADDRFGANYGGAEGAAFVRDALRVYAEAHL